MEWIPVFVSVCAGSDFLGLPSAVRGSWLALAVYCGAQENGGTIVGARAWDERRWILAGNLVKSDVDELVAAGLATWEGDNLAVAFYDATAEERARTRKQRAATAARKMWDARKASGDASSTAPGCAPSTAPSNAEERRGEERTREEMTGEESKSSAAGAAPLLTLSRGTPSRTRTRKGRGTNADHAPFVAWWAAAYSEKHAGASYLTSDADHGIVAALLRDVGRAELELRARAYLDSGAWFTRDGHDLRGLKRHWNELAPGGASRGFAAPSKSFAGGDVL